MFLLAAATAGSATRRWRGVAQSGPWPTQSDLGREPDRVAGQTSGEHILYQEVVDERGTTTSFIR